MNCRKLISLSLFCSILFASGGFDNGTATGRGRFKFDLTWNPFDKIDFGQTYCVFSYGITDRFDFHGYFSRHPGPFYTWYAGGFFQFHKSKKIDLATAIGIRKRIDDTFTNIFIPQLLYTIKISKKINIGGSFVNVYNYNQKENYGLTFDMALGYKIPLKSNKLESITINLGAFHPATWEPNNFFLPTYSIDFHFK